MSYRVSMQFICHCAVSECVVYSNCWISPMLWPSAVPACLGWPGCMCFITPRAAPKHTAPKDGDYGVGLPTSRHACIICVCGAQGVRNRCTLSIALYPHPPNFMSHWLGISPFSSRAIFMFTHLFKVCQIAPSWNILFQVICGPRANRTVKMKGSHKGVEMLSS